MDIIDKVTYKWEPTDNESEKTRLAFQTIFENGDENAELVAKFIVRACKWEDQTEYNDPIIEAKMNALRNVVLSIKKQLNIGKIDYE